MEGDGRRPNTEGSAGAKPGSPEVAWQHPASPQRGGSPCDIPCRSSEFSWEIL